MSDSQTQWLEAIRRMTATPQSAAAYLDQRLLFTTAVAGLLSHSDPACDQLLYGVWLEGHVDPIYIGQTMDGRRRLWDLPIGESHHLGNSFPPEIWSRVVVVYWGRILASDPASVAATEASHAAIGLGLEFLLQKQTQPLFNRRKKRRDGAWREVRWNDSDSIGAKVAPSLTALFDEVMLTWKELSSVIPSDVAKIERVTGRVVFPSRLICQISQSPESTQSAR
jgi:hypothetical protein